MAEALGVSVQTLYRWERAGHIDVSRTPTGHRRYDLEAVKSQALTRAGRGAAA